VKGGERRGGEAVGRRREVRRKGSPQCLPPALAGTAPERGVPRPPPVPYRRVACEAGAPWRGVRVCVGGVAYMEDRQRRLPHTPFAQVGESKKRGAANGLNAKKRGTRYKGRVSCLRALFFVFTGARETQLRTARPAVSLVQECDHPIDTLHQGCTKRTLPVENGVFEPTTTALFHSERRKELFSEGTDASISAGETRTRSPHGITW